jgi:hypothetical protein
VIPISTEVYANYPPSSSSSASRHAYSGRPRRSTLTDADAPSSSLRTRPAVVQSTTIARPASPLSRSYEPSYVKSAVTPRHNKTTMYSVDNGSAKLIAETEPARDYRDSARQERGYHLSGSSHRPREVDDSSFSYTDAAGMYRDTEPRWRPRRGSVDRGTRRPSSVIEPLGPSGRVSRDMGPPPSMRGFDKISSDLGRTSSVRDPVRPSSRETSRERTNTYDPYANGANYDVVPVRTRSTMPIVTQHRDSRDERYYNDDIDDRRDSRRRSRQFTDDAVEVRGFGIRRSSSADRYATPGLTAEMLGPRIPPPPTTPAAAIYGAEPLVVMPTTQDYIPRSVEDNRRPSEDRRAMPPSTDYIPRPADDDRRGSEDRRPKEYLPRPADDDRRGSEDRRPKDYVPRAVDDDRRGSDDRRPKDYIPRPAEDDRRGSEDRRERDRDRDRDSRTERDYERPRERGDINREKPRRDQDERSNIAVPAAAAAAGLAAGVALDKRSRDKKYESDEERSRRPSRDKKYESDEERSRRAPPRAEPNATEDEREQRYAEKDRLRDEERKKDKRPTEVLDDPDAEYRRRVQQSAMELSQISRQRSHEEERSDSDRERRRRERQEREDRERLERRKGSKDEGPAPIKEPSRRDRDLELETQASHQHNRYDSRHNSILDRDVVQEPEQVERSRGASSIATTAPASDVASRDAPSQGTERRVTIVEPPRKEPSPEPKVKSILRKPTEKFPEHPNPIREGVAPLKEKLEKDKRGKDIPSGAKWTKIDRRLVNPQSLEEKGERFEERMDCVIVLRVLTKEEIQSFADRTREIRGEQSASFGYLG